MYSGILVIDKPGDWTSHDVVAKLRGVFKQKRVGHGGTLDPMATGVLPIFVGRATRAAEFCENAEKEYIAGIRFGITTDTQDITGTVLTQIKTTASVNELIAELTEILPQFRGEIEQIPPMYSAVKQGGKKLYELARKGIEVERKARDVFISTLEILTESDCTEREHAEFNLRVVCSKGTYIRTLCHDIGSALGYGATLSSLRRTRAGAYGIESAYTLDSVISANAENNLHDLLLPIDSIFPEVPSISLSEADTRKVKNGVRIKISGNESGKVKVYAPDGEFLLLGEVLSDELRTVKSFYEV
ncbi:MAG: tRNA pseudouridine(55) synthase TruB [Oscillospiraceae bacterium]|nr:tRNA pseudouridine(55) synthase TruB [Oscillospiraceae bacterium]